MAYRVANWQKYYENNRTRELKKMAWVPMPNKFDGDGYTALLDHENGAAHFGAWCALVEVASRCDARGTLLRNGDLPHTSESLSRITRIPIAIWEEVMPRLVSIGWVEKYKIPQEDAAKPQEDAPPPHPSANEWNGMERKEGNGKNTSRAVALSPKADGAVETRPIYHLFEQAFVGKNEEFDYKREGRALKALEEHALARASPEDFAKMLLVVFWQLTHGEDKFWRSQPFLPSVLASGGIYPRVLKAAENMKTDQLTKEQAETIREVFG